MIDSTDEEKHEKALALLEDILRSPGGYAVTAQVVAGVPLRREEEAAGGP